MIVRTGDRGKKSEMLLGKNSNNNPVGFKRNMLQSQEFASTARRHSVYGTPIPNQDFPEPFSSRVSSKELKSLQKYRSGGRQ